MTLCGQIAAKASAAVCRLTSKYVRVRGEKMEYIKLAHSIKSKDGNGKILAEITFPETEPGVYTIDHTYVSEALAGQGIAGELVQMAVDQIKEQGGEVRATCSYASAWLKKKGM